MKTLVTGSAGFIGSHLCERLLHAGHSVLGVDALTGYYDPRLKQDNVEQCRRWPAFRFVNSLVTELADETIDGVDIIFHLAAQPGVRASWGEQFDTYLQHNVLATQKLLEKAQLSQSLQRFVYASSSSVYGAATSQYIREDHPRNPYSPYGVTKLAGEQLCMVGAANYGLPAVALRLFTVFGPRQRPDMLIHQLITAALSGSTFSLYGDGSQYRDFTYVKDVAEAMLLAAGAETQEKIFNIAGSQVASVNEVIAMVEEITGACIAIDRKGERKGDVRGTRADIALAATQLAYTPKWSLRDGILEQARCVAQRLGVSLPRSTQVHSPGPISADATPVH